MGRTLPTTTQIILDEQQAFCNFRRALRREDQAVFDELFARTRKHIMAINQTDHVLPFEAILLAMLIDGNHLINQVIGLTRRRPRMNGGLTQVNPLKTGYKGHKPDYLFNLSRVINHAGRDPAEEAG